MSLYSLINMLNEHERSLNMQWDSVITVFASLRYQHTSIYTFNAESVKLISTQRSFFIFVQTLKRCSQKLHLFVHQGCTYHISPQTNWHSSNFQDITIRCTRLTFKPSLSTVQLMCRKKRNSSRAGQKTIYHKKITDKRQTG